MSTRWTSFAGEAVLAGLLVQWQSGWKPHLTLATDPARPWFPVVFGMLGGKTLTTRCSEWARKVTDDKMQSAELLRGAGLQVPEGRAFWPQQRAEALAYAESLPSPVVVKPARGGQGLGVSVNVRSDEDFLEALKLMHLDGYGDSPFLVERELPGRNYRFTASPNRVYSVLERIPAHVVGNGFSSIGQLVHEKNVLRQEASHQGPGRQITFDATSQKLLERASLTLQSVPEFGVRVPLALIASTSRGSDTVQVDSATHESLHGLAMRAVRAIPGLDIAGVDLILSSGHESPVDQQDATVLEINASAQISGSLAPTSGPARNLFRLFLEDLASEAGLTISDSPSLSEIAVSIKYLRRGTVEIANCLSSISSLEVTTPPVDRDDVLILKGDREQLLQGLVALGGDVGLVTAVSWSIHANKGLSWLDWVLQPTTLVPNDHCEILARS